jgi:glycosyltransferase involved in cell wall biosynthesis
LLIPTLNEAKNVAILLNSLAVSIPEIHEIIVVDGSVDETAEVARSLGASVIAQEGNGKGDALRQAFAAEYGGDIVVSIDADGSNRIEEIPQLVEAVVNGADIAKGSRFMSGGGSTDLSLIRRIGNELFVRLVNLIWSAHYTDLCYGFVAFRKDALISLTPLLESKNFEIETEICIKARKLGLKVVEVPSVELRRRYGSSKVRGVHDSFTIFRTVLHELVLSLKARISHAIWNVSHGFISHIEHTQHECQRDWPR